MNIIFAYAMAKDPSVHRANEKGSPLCGSVVRKTPRFPKDVRSQIESEIRAERKLKRSRDKNLPGKGQKDFGFKDPRIEIKWEDKKIYAAKIMPTDETIEDIGEVSCLKCLTIIEKENHG